MLNLVAWLLTPFMLSAQTDGSGKSNLSLPQILKNKKFEENAVITNPELRADAGSRSRYSLQTYLAYYGAPAERPFHDKMPNPDNLPFEQYTMMAGSLSLKYRVDKSTAWSFGTGVSAETPFHGVEKMYLQDPTVGWARFYRLRDIEMKSAFSGSITTNERYADRGQAWSLKAAQAFSHRFGDTGYMTGVETSLLLFFFDRTYEQADGNMSTYLIGIYPFLSYDLNRTYSIKTSMGQAYSNPRRTNDLAFLDTRKLNQRLGLGISFSRDVYFYPYLSFLPTDFTWDSTTLSFSTTLSIF